MSCVTKGVSVRWIFVVNAEATCTRDPAAEARGRASPPTTADAGPAGARGTGPDPG
jgi:hypothetical protein